MNDAVITLNGLEKRFPGMDKPAVAPLDCTIHAGYVTGLVGPDGAGKTTLMRMLAGLLKPDSGNATVIGFDPIKNDGALHAVLGYMPQKFGLYEDLTVMENLNLYADLRSVTGEARKQTFARLLEVSSLMDVNPQRVAVAAARTANPRDSDFTCAYSGDSVPVRRHAGSD